MRTVSSIQCRPRCGSSVVLLAWAALGACSSDAPTSLEGTRPDGGANDSVVVVVDATSDVSALPASGSYKVRVNEPFPYSFRADSLKVLTVRVGGLLAPASDVLVIRAPTHLSAVALPDTSDARRTSNDLLFDRVFASPTAANVESLRQGTLAAERAGDPAAAADFERARFRAMMRIAPAAYLRLLGRIDSISARAHESRLETPALRRASAGLTAAAPATYVLYINGILTFAGYATDARNSLMALLKSNGGGNRVWLPLAYHNPILSPELSSPGRCVQEMLWARDAVRGGSARHIRSIVLRMNELLTHRRTSECVSTNARVILDYLVQVMGSTSALIPSEVALLERIENIRAAGSNIVVVGFSQGSVIARNVLAQLAPSAPGRGCAALLSLGSPIQHAPIPSVDYQASIIARGQQDGVHDLLFPLWPGRTDGLSSRLTDEWDRSPWVTVPNAVPFDGGLVAHVGLLWLQFLLHDVVGTYLDDGGYANAVRDRAHEAADMLDAACSWASFEVTPPPTATRVEENVLDTVRLTATNRSSFSTRLRITPNVEGMASAMIAFPGLAEFELAGNAKSTLQVPVLAKPGIVPGDYAMRFAVTGQPVASRSDASIVSVEVPSRLRVTVGASNWTVVGGSATVAIRARTEVRDSTRISIQLNDGQRKEFQPRAEWSEFAFQLTPGRNVLELFTEYLSRGQLLVQLEVDVKEATDGGPRSTTLGPLNGRGIDNPSRMTIRSQTGMPSISQAADQRASRRSKSPPVSSTGRR